MAPPRVIASAAIAGLRFAVLSKSLHAMNAFARVASLLLVASGLFVATPAASAATVIPRATSFGHFNAIAMEPHFEDAVLTAEGDRLEAILIIRQPAHPLRSSGRSAASSCALAIDIRLT